VGCTLHALKDGRACDLHLERNPTRLRNRGLRFLPFPFSLDGVRILCAVISDRPSPDSDELRFLLTGFALEQPLLRTRGRRKDRTLDLTPLAPRRKRSASYCLSARGLARPPREEEPLWPRAAPDRFPRARRIAGPLPRTRAEGSKRPRFEGQARRCVGRQAFRRARIFLPANAGERDFSGHAT